MNPPALPVYHMERMESNDKQTDETETGRGIHEHG
jgi:hypothetical protein